MNDLSKKTFESKTLKISPNYGSYVNNQYYSDVICLCIDKLSGDEFRDFCVTSLTLEEARYLKDAIEEILSIMS